MTDWRAAGRLWPLLFGAGLLAVGATACDSSSSADAPATTTITVPTIQAAVVVSTNEVVEQSVVATTLPVVAPPPTTPIDGAALLASAIVTMSTTYHFTSVVSVDGIAALTADGDHVGDGVRLALTGSAGVVNYIITPDGSWVMPDGGEWEQLDSSAATSDPITALAAPTSVAVSASDGTTTTLIVTVPASALGLPAGADVNVTSQVVDGQLRHVQFDSVVDGRPATVTADFGPVIDGSPVVAPI